MSKKNCFIIGNGSLPFDLSTQINNADYVLRFNQPPLSTNGHDYGWSGRKTDCLMLCNSGKPMQLKLGNSQFLHSPFLQTAVELILVYHPAIIRQFFKQPLITSRLLHGRKRDWTLEAIDTFGAMGKKITVLPPQFYIKACSELGISPLDLTRIFPSTGYLGIQHMLTCCNLAEWTITLTGFSWQGWKRHDWQAEADWVKQQIKTGRFIFI